MRFVVRVRPGSSITSVGGGWDGIEPPALVVSVRERAVDGRANDAVVAAIAAAFGVPRRAVAILVGHTSRTKHVTVDGDDDAVAQRLAALLDPPGGG